jgi:hypothetical protein
MSNEEDRERGEAWLRASGIRRLPPASTRVYLGMFSVLHVQVNDDEHYRGVFAMRMFPVRYQDQYISLHYTDDADKDHEIGVLEDLSVFPEEQRRLINGSLSAHYYEQWIVKIHDIRSEYGLLFFDVETRQGRKEFVMPWRGDRAEEYGDKGKVLLDAMDNRYIIKDMQDLSALDLAKLKRFIYW